MSVVNLSTEQPLNKRLEPEHHFPISHHVIISDIHFPARPETPPLEWHWVGKEKVFLLRLNYLIAIFRFSTQQTVDN